MLGLAAFAFVAVGVRDGAATLAGVGWSIRPARLLGATLLEVGLLAWSVVLWRRILACFEGTQPSFLALLKVWCGTTLAKYLPGSVWAVAASAEMASGAGVSPVALSASFLLQATLNLAGAVLLALALNGSLGSDLLVLPNTLVFACLIVTIALLHPSVVNALVQRGSRLAKREAPQYRAGWSTGLVLLALHVATWAAYGLAFELFLTGVTPVGHATWTMLATVNAVAFVAGFIAFFAPGGVGVREAALVGLLVPLIAGQRLRIALAAASRVWLVLTEVLAGAIVLFAQRVAVRRTRTVARTESRIAFAPHTSQPPRDQREKSSGIVRGVRATPLTDSALALLAMVDACRTAKHSIWISQLAFDADCAVSASACAEQPLLLDAILHAAQHARVDVRIVLNGGLLLDTSPVLQQAIRSRYDGDNVALRTVKAFPQVMHAKMLMVDRREAWLMGCSFVNGYWENARHVAAGDPAGDAGAGDRPLHDAAIHLEGAVIPELARWYTELFADAAPLPGEPTASITVFAPPQIASDDDARGSVRVLRTVPRSRMGRADGSTEVLDWYLDAIRGARECIYLESQYFSARPVARAVRAALDAHADLELIVVMNQNPDITGYRGWQNARLAENGLLDHPRAGAFALWSTTPSLRAPGNTELTQVFVHSKVAVIDDQMATVGTANLDGASLHSYGDDFGSWMGRRVFGAYRNFDISVALLDGAAGEPQTGAAAALRRQLWTRHLGIDDAQLVHRPDDGWLPLWRATATANARALARGGAMRGNVTSYVTAPHPRGQLAALGIDVARAGLELRFDPSRMEVVASPGWIKRLLPGPVRRWVDA